MSRKLSLAITLVVKVVIASLVITSFWMIALIKLVVKVVITCFWMIVVLTLEVKVVIASFWMIAVISEFLNNFMESCNKL